MQYAAHVAEVHVIRFDVDEDAPPITPERWTSNVRMLILEFQPAVSASLEGSPARAIRIESCSSVSVAPGLLAEVERLSATSLHVEGRTLEAWPNVAGKADVRLGVVRTNPH